MTARTLPAQEKRKCPDHKNTHSVELALPVSDCISRCARCGFRCGVDDYSRFNYKHRKDWFEDKLHQTTEAFAVNLYAYVVMSRYYQRPLHNSERVET